MRSLRIGLVLALRVSATTSLFAQQGTSQIAGTVTDEQGAILTGVSILVTNEDTGLFRD